MTVQSEVSRVSYAGDGSTVAFSTTFYFLANADLRVIIRDANGTETLQVTGTDYSVSGAGNANGGTVTFTSAPASGETVVIIRDPPLTQLTDYNDQDPFPADSHERALDKLTMLIGRLAEKFARSVLLQETSTLTGLVFPNPEAGKFFRWNGDADGIENAALVGDTEALPATAGRYLRRNDDGDAFAALSATQSTNLDALRDMALGAQLVLSTASNSITAAHAGRTLIADRASSIALNFAAAAALGDRFMVLVKNVNTGTLTLNPDGAELIDGVASKTLAQNESLILLCDGTGLRTLLHFVVDPDLDDGWATQPIGVPIGIMDDITGTAAPPTNQSYRYILLTAGEDGVGDYNEGVLDNEIVSGSSPDIVATADIDDGDSPMDGQTVDLLNSSRKFLRPGSAGTSQDSQNLLHGHQYAGSGYADNPGSDGGFTTNADNTYISDVHTGTASTDRDEQIGGSGGDEARPRNLGLTYYMRIK